MPEVSIVSDTSPLLYLGRIGQLAVLPQLFSRVYVPEQVAGELEAGRLICGDTPDPRQLPWVELVSVAPALIAALPSNTLGLGECATIAYARSHGPMLVALDDRRARMLARQLALPVVGLVGLLVRAKKAGLLPAVKPCLEAAQSRGFYLHPDTYTQALLLVGEQ